MPNGTRSRRPTILAAGILVAALAAAAIWYAWSWEPRSHVPSEVAYWYRRQFQPGQIGSGFVLVGVGRDADRPQLLVHHVRVPEAVAGDLVMMGAAERGRVVAEIACPRRDHPIWTKLNRRHDVAIELSSGKGDFATVWCRAQIF